MPPPPTRQHAFPLLKWPELCQCLKDLGMQELGVPCSEDALKNPTPVFIEAIFRQFVAMLMNDPCDPEAPLTFKENDARDESIEHAELHQASLPKAKFVEKWTQLMLMAGVDTFSALDELTHPTEKRLRVQLSAVVNYGRYHDSQVQKWEAINQRIDELKAEKQGHEDEHQRLVTEVQAHRALVEQEAPAAAALQATNVALEEKVAELYTQQGRLIDQKEELKDAKARDEAAAAELRMRKADAEKERDSLKAQVVPDPTRAKQELAALREQVEKEKENVRALDAERSRDALKLRESERAEEGVDAVLGAQAACEEEVKRTREVVKKTAALVEREQAEQSAAMDTDYQIKTVENQIANTQKRMAALDAQHAKELQASAQFGRNAGAIRRNSSDPPHLPPSQVEEQQLINQRGHADASDAERDALNAQLSAAQEQLRELKDKHTRAGVAHSEYTAKMKELEEQLIKQVHSYHADLRAAMTATAC